MSKTEGIIVISYSRFSLKTIGRAEAMCVCKCACVCVCVCVSLCVRACVSE